MAPSAQEPVVADTAPSDPHLTEYDQAHLTIYLRLIDAEDAGASWREVASVVLGLDAAHEPVRAQKAHETHLARARWLAQAGYRQLLRPLDS